MKKAYLIPHVRVVDMEPHTSILEYSGNKEDLPGTESGGDVKDPDAPDVETRKKLWGGAGSRSTFGNSLWS